APVVVDRDRVVGVDRDGDLGAVAGHRLVDRVVHDLVDEVVQTPRGRRADVHARPLPHGFQPLQDLDLPRGIVVRSHFFRGLRHVYPVGGSTRLVRVTPSPPARR